MTQPCEQHLNAPTFDGLCGGCTQYPADMAKLSAPEAAEVTEPDGHAEPPSDEETNPALHVRPDPRQPAYDAVYEYIRSLDGYLLPDPVHRNAVIWRAVHTALDATHVGRCVSSHCVEGDHMVFVEEQPGSTAKRTTVPGESTLRDLIAAAIYERNNPGRRWADAHPDDLVCYGNDADAALTVVQPGAVITATVARMSDAGMQRVTALYERWVKAGPPPLGTSLARWWDARLVDLHDAILPSADQPKEK